MNTFEAVMKKGAIRTVLDKDTGTIVPVVSLYFEVPFNSELWGTLGEVAGDVVRITIEKYQPGFSFEKGGKK